ncbi:RelA/SpoT family protein, partial [candidate division KSB1 bacterium]
MKSVNLKDVFYDKFLELKTRIESYISNGEIDILEKAFWFGFEAHKNQYRRSGEPYFDHCVEAAKILSGLKMDIRTVSAGLLHDAVEDTGVTLNEIEKEFGADIANLVDGVTKITDLKFEKVELKQAENFRKMVLSMAKDIRVVIIKFADRLHNMRTLRFLPKRKQVLIAQETLDVYAPLARRFGIADMAWQFEDLALEHLDFTAYKLISKKITQTWDERFKQIEKIKKLISEALRKLNVSANIFGRPKSYYSIYRKMQAQNVSFEEIYDLLAIRIITEKQEDCYAAIGVIHTLYTPVADRFKDYIATPKSNGYQSLHTTVMTPGGKMVEVQIRTKDMDNTAEMGIAAHWLYKSNSDKELDDKLTWVRELLDLDKEADPGEFMKSFKSDLFQDEIFVFTPKGRLINLPENSTPVDFAFAVHSEIGLRCIGAKVNSKVVPLYTILKNGDEVEIITSTKSSLQEYWSTFVVTSRARQQIDKWFKENKRLQYEKLGKEILKNELAEHDMELNDDILEMIKQHSGYSNLDSLWQVLGKHEISVGEIGRRVFPKIYHKQKISFLNRLPKILKKTNKDSIEEAIVKIQGENPLVLKLSKCCKPVPGDKIVGFHLEEKGIVVHRIKCAEIPKILSEKEHGIRVEWADSLKNEFPVSIQVSASDRKHLIRDITLAISKQDINVVSINMEVHGIAAICNITLEIKDIDELKSL